MRILKFVIVIALVTLTSSVMANDRAARENYRLGKKLFAERKYELALPYFEMANTLSDASSTALLGLAQCERALGLHSAALVHLKLFVQKNPRHDYTARAKSTIATLEKEHRKLTSKRETSEISLEATSKWSQPVFWLQTEPASSKKAPKVFAVELPK
ncbi:MAG: hypothetical protein VYC39_14330 [Myxococcota bacterium]|nr:hypothetical protein [Myxococcota bacterium]